MKKIINILKNKKYENIGIVIISALALIIAILPIFKKGTLIGDDFGFHLSRIQGVEQGVREYSFPVKIFHNIANSYTYGAGLFYCNFFLYFPAILRLLSLPIEVVTKVFVTTSILGMFITTYISVKHITKNKLSAIVSAILVITSRYFLLDVYWRFAVGEYLAMIFMPLIVAGMWDFVYNDFKNPKYIIIGFIGVIFSHTISVILSVIYCIVYFLINIKKMLTNKENIIKLIKSAILVACITVVYWLPMLEQMTAQTLRYQTVKLSHTYKNVVSIKSIFVNEKFSLGYAQTILFFIGLFILIKNWKKIKTEVKQFYIIGAIALLLICFKPFWEYIKILDIIQFPWRLLGVVTILNSMAFSMFVVKKEKIVKLVAIVISLVFCAVGVSGFARYADLTEDLYALPITLGGGKEYLPANSLIDEGVEIDYEKLDFPQEALTENNEKIKGTKKVLTFEFENRVQDEKYLIPFFYYKGYKAKHIDNSGIETKIEATLGDKGLVEVKNLQNPGKIIVWYDGTIIQKISYAISAISSIAVLIIYIKHKITKNAREN